MQRVILGIFHIWLFCNTLPIYYNDGTYTLHDPTQKQLFYAVLLYGRLLLKNKNAPPNKMEEATCKNIQFLSLYGLKIKKGCPQAASLV